MGVNALEQRRRIAESMPHEVSKTGDVVTFNTDVQLPLEVLAQISPVQDLHGYEYPWVGGAGKNLFGDNASPTTDRFLNSSGSLISDSSWIVSDYIAVTPNTEYTFNPNTSSGKSAKHCYYDTNKTFLSAISSGQQTFTTPADCYYMRFSYRTTSYDIQLELGSSASSYAPYSNICPISGWTGAKVKRVGYNLFDKENAVSGYYINSRGARKSVSNGYISAFIYVKENTTYRISQMFSSNLSRYVAFYRTPDSSTCISSVSPNYKGGTFTTPLGTRYMRCSLSSDYLDTLMISVGSDEQQEYESFSGSNMYDVTFPDPPGTVYGGTLKVNKDGTGTLTVDRESITLDGTESWTKLSGSGGYHNENYYFKTSIGSRGYAVAMSELNSCYKKADISTQTTVEGLSVKDTSSPNACSVMIRAYGKSTTVSQFIEKIEANPVQVVFVLSEPITYNLTAEQVGQIIALNGINNVWSDTGSITVSNIWEH